MNNNYEKAKEEGIKEWRNIRGTVITLPQKIEGELVIDYDAMNKRDKSFLSSFAEKIKEGVETDMTEKYVLKERELKIEATEQYLCPSYVRDGKVIDCNCGKCF